jgi:hypothetical protein
MENLKIYVSENSDGYAFSLTLTQKKLLQETFGEKVHPASHIFVNYGIRNNFKAMLNWLEKAVLPVLLGINDKNDIKGLKTISFYDPQTDLMIDKLNLDD